MIPLVQRYLVRDFLTLFLVITLGLSLIASLVEIIDKIDDFTRRGAPLGVLVLYAALTTPRYLLYLMPMAALVSSMFILGQAAKRNETVAVMASGGRMKSIVVPFIHAGVLFCLISFLLGEFIAPDFSERAHRLRDSISRKGSSIAAKAGRAWLRERDYIVKIDLYVPNKDSIDGITLLRLKDDMLIERIEAKSGEWHAVWESRERGYERRLEGPRSAPDTRGLWTLRDVTVYDIPRGSVTRLKEMQSDIIDPPEVLGKGVQKTDEMTFRELWEYTRRLQEAGIKNTKLLIDMQSRISYPLINVIMIVLGVSLAMRGGMKSGLVTTAVGICIGLLYWVGYTTSLSLGYTAILPPVMSAWIIPLAFGGAAVYLFRQIPE